MRDLKECLPHYLGMPSYLQVMYAQLIPSAFSDLLEINHIPHLHPYGTHLHCHYPILHRHNQSLLYMMILQFLHALLHHPTVTIYSLLFHTQHNIECMPTMV